jgi:hypothetical protein
LIAIFAKGDCAVSDFNSQTTTLNIDYLHYLLIKHTYDLHLLAVRPVEENIGQILKLFHSAGVVALKIQSHGRR